MFIASIGLTLSFFVSFIGDLPGVAGMSIVIGVAEADGATFGFLVISGIGDGVMGVGEGPIVILGAGERGTIVMPGIGAIFACGDGWAAETMWGPTEIANATATFTTERLSKEKRTFPSISYTT